MKNIATFSLLILFATNAYAEEENVCLGDAHYGLCNSYCNALNCDEDQDVNNKACEQVRQNYEKKTGEAPPCDLTSCPGITRAVISEGEEVRACVTDSDCGQVILGTSCGCTRNWVANQVADLTEFNDLKSRYNSMACGSLFVTDCDCPATDGFKCDAGQCTWNYIPR